MLRTADKRVTVMRPTEIDMDSIASADLMELVLLQRESFDFQLQFWITATFAVIVASFVAGQKLTVRYRLVLGALYLLTTPNPRQHKMRGIGIQGSL